jgi:hypothetical protein
MPILQASRFQGLLRQSFALLDSLRLTVLDDIFPTFPIQDPAEAFLQLHKEVLTVFGGISVIPAAADIASVDLAPAAASARAILDVMHLALSNTGAAAMNVIISHVGYAATTPPAVTQLTPLDGRRIGSEIHPQRSAFGFTAQQAGSAITANSWGFTLAAGVGIIIPWRATLYRSGLRIQGTLVNNPMRLGVYGQERLLEPSEERSKVSSAP